MHIKPLCFIPARGGSKRIPHKNLLPIAGKSLLRRTIDTAIQADIFDKIVVSSDDPKVKEEVLRLGQVSFHDRDPKLANDLARVPEVVHQFLSSVPDEARAEEIIVLLPPCPFRTATHLKEAYELFKRKNPSGFLVSVTRYDFPPQFALRWADDQEKTSLKLLQPEVYKETTRSQSVEQLLHPNGAIYISSVPAFLQSKSFFTNPLIGYEMPPEDSFDIDWPHQLEIAKALLTTRNEK